MGVTERYINVIGVRNEGKVGNHSDSIYVHISRSFRGLVSPADNFNVLSLTKLRSAFLLEFHITFAGMSPECMNCHCHYATISVILRLLCTIILCCVVSSVQNSQSRKTGYACHSCWSSDRTAYNGTKKAQHLYDGAQ